MTHIFSLLQTDGNVGVQGPLRIYWGLKKPIMLKQYDDMPSKPIPKKRYSSIITDNSRDLNTLPELHREVSKSDHRILAPLSNNICMIYLTIILFLSISYKCVYLYLMLQKHILLSVTLKLNWNWVQRTFQNFQVV